MQYTGLKDKDRKKIYEGDIVKWADLYTGESRDEDRVFIVENIQNFFETKGYYEAEYGERWEKELEIIGNIYENPELLEEGRNEN